MEKISGGGERMTVEYPIQQHSSSSLSTEIALFQLFSASTGIHFNIVYFPRSSFFTWK